MPILLERLFEKRVKQLFVCFNVQAIEKKRLFFQLSGLIWDWVITITLYTILLQIQGELIMVAEYPRLRWELEDD